MNKITCNMCADLIPLVKDGIASEDSRQAVEEHIKTCETCRIQYEGAGTEPFTVNVDFEVELGKLKRKLQIFSTVLMMFGVFFGLGLTASENMFYNSLLMPVVGVLGYLLFRWRAVYLVPGLLFVAQCLINLMGVPRDMVHMSLMGIVMWVGIYSIFVLLGVLVAGLLHFAFRKEK